MNLFLPSALVGEAETVSAVRPPCFPKVKMASGASIVFCCAKLPLLSGVLLSRKFIVHLLALI
jgi:hypothetical protein